MNHLRRKYPQPRVIYVDVDGTLHKYGAPNMLAIKWCKEKKDRGFTLILWSMRGEAYARMFANSLGIEDLFSHICSKPGYVLDDKGLSWVKFVTVISHLRTPVIGHSEALFVQDWSI